MSYSRGVISRCRTRKVVAGVLPFRHRLSSTSFRLWDVAGFQPTAANGSGGNDSVENTGQNTRVEVHPVNCIPLRNMLACDRGNEDIPLRAPASPCVGTSPACSTHARSSSTGNWYFQPHKHHACLGTEMTLTLQFLEDFLSAVRNW